MDLETAFFGTSNHPLSDLTGVGLLTGTFLQNAIVVAGIILVMTIIFAGIRMISGAGDQNPAVFKSGQEMLTAAVIGFIIVVLAYWIVDLMQKSLGVSILN
jgi:hypothetical protein